jgi:nucleoid DNA-binding protein
MPDLTIESFVEDIARRSNIDPAAAETAVRTILSVIQQEADPSKVSQLFGHLPG